jgi:hypothetical protein
MTRREEIELELQNLDKKIYALQATRDEIQKEYDSTPETQAGKNDSDNVFRESLKAYADHKAEIGELRPLKPGEIVRE